MTVTDFNVYISFRKYIYLISQLLQHVLPGMLKSGTKVGDARQSHKPSA